MGNAAESWINYPGNGWIHLILEIIFAETQTSEANQTIKLFLQKIPFKIRLIQFKINLSKNVSFSHRSPHSICKRYEKQGYTELIFDKQISIR